MIKYNDEGPDSFDKVFNLLFLLLFNYTKKLTDDHDLANYLVIDVIWEFYKRGCDLRSEETRKQLYKAVSNQLIDTQRKKLSYGKIEKRWVRQIISAAEGTRFSTEIVESEFLRKAIDCMEELR